MAKTSKKITKKAPRKVYVAAMPKPRKFNLTQASDAEQQRMIGALTALGAHEGWMLLRQTLEANVKVLDTQIIDKTDINGAPLSDIECDKLRDRRMIFQELIEKPSALLTQLTRTEEEPDTDDPYFTDIKQLHRRHQEADDGA